MIRKALIISNPGADGAENFCEGVLKDVKNYEAYLLSPLGGAWEKSEIKTLNRPSLSEVKSCIQDHTNADYSLVIFTGHGWHSTIDADIGLELNSVDSIALSDLRQGTNKRLIITDCCRVALAHTIYKKAFSSIGLLNEQALGISMDRQECRAAYDEAIRNCRDGLIVTYSCSHNQASSDDSETGGYYTKALFDATLKWFQESVSTGNYSIVKAHNDASPKVMLRSNGNQSPTIEKPKTLPYFPFAVMA